MKCTMIDNQAKFQNLLTNASKVMIIGHQGPDPDAISSVLLAQGFIKTKYPEKMICSVIDGVWGEYGEGLYGVENLENADPFEVAKEYLPDLVVLLDGNDPKRFSQENSEVFAEWLIENGNKVVCIDHHEPTPEAEAYAVTHNIQASNCAEEVFDTFTKMGFPHFPGVYELVMLGMVSDTGRFLFPNNYPQRTFAIASEAIKAGVSIERIAARLETYNPIEVSIAATFLKNLRDEGGFNYAYLTDAQARELWFEARGNRAMFSMGMHIVINQFLKNTRPNACGITLYKDMMEEGFYKGSLRSFKEVLDCNEVAKALGGGGHKAAAGFRIAAANLRDAEEKVLGIMRRFISLSHE